MTFTNHAIEQYTARLSRLGATVPKNPEKTLRKLLLRATDESMNNWHVVKRLIKHDYKIVKYKIVEGWRFVIAEDGVVITVERVDPAQN